MKIIFKGKSPKLSDYEDEDKITEDTPPIIRRIVLNWIRAEMGESKKIHQTCNTSS